MTKPEWIDRVTTFETYRNQPGGFWCVSASPEAADHAISRQFNISECQTVMLMTDGVSTIIDNYHALPNWHAALNLGRSDPERLITLTRNTELQDPEAKKWPRCKIHDDKAVAVVEF